MSAIDSFHPHTMNIELTTKCPLHCPQCYCSLTGGKSIALDTAIFWLNEGKQAGVEEVMLSGGETLCYEHLFELISAASKIGLKTNVALSGVGFSQLVYDRLMASGVTGIFISLNGATEKINALTRDGYNYAIAALQLLKENNYTNTTLNWVMHSNNADDFENVVNLAEFYNVASIVIIGVKPDSKHALSTIPSKDQIVKIKEQILSHKGNTRIFVESCNSPLLTYICDTRLFGNMNVGKNRGCGAGRNTFSVNVDGLLSPCRHLDYFEKAASLTDYISKSPVIYNLQQRTVEPAKEPCCSCRFQNNCIPCAAINSKLEGNLNRGFKSCPIYEKTEQVDNGSTENTM